MEIKPIIEIPTARMGYQANDLWLEFSMKPRLSKKHFPVGTVGSFASHHLPTRPYTGFPGELRLGTGLIPLVPTGRLVGPSLQFRGDEH